MELFILLLLPTYALALVCQECYLHGHLSCHSGRACHQTNEFCKYTAGKDGHIKGECKHLDHFYKECGTRAQDFSSLSWEHGVFCCRNQGCLNSFNSPQGNTAATTPVHQKTTPQTAQTTSQSTITTTKSPTTTVNVQTTTTRLTTTIGVQTLATQAPYRSTPKSGCHDMVDQHGCETYPNVCGSDMGKTFCPVFCGQCGKYTVQPPTTPVLPVQHASTHTPRSCYQCGDFDSGVKCSSAKLTFGVSTPCQSGAYCMTDIHNTFSGTVDVIKRCVGLAECRKKWYEETSDQAACVNYDSVNRVPDLSCHFCCTTDGCNSHFEPSMSSLYQG